MTLRDKRRGLSLADITLVDPPGLLDDIVERTFKRSRRAWKGAHRPVGYAFLTVLGIQPDAERPGTRIQYARGGETKEFYLPVPVRMPLDPRQRNSGPFILALRVGQGDAGQPECDLAYALPLQSMGVRRVVHSAGERQPAKALFRWMCRMREDGWRADIEKPLRPIVLANGYLCEPDYLVTITLKNGVKVYAFVEVNGDAPAFYWLGKERPHAEMKAHGELILYDCSEKWSPDPDALLGRNLNKWVGRLIKSGKAGG